MTLVVSCDFLVAPSVCLPGELTNCVESLISVKQQINEKNANIKIEPDVMGKLTNHDLFPCIKRFNRNIEALKDQKLYSGRDIAKLVNNILSKIDENNSFGHGYLVEWGEQAIQPTLNGSIPARKEELLDLVRNMSVTSWIHSIDLTMLHYPIEMDHSTVHLNAEVKCIVPEDINETPFQIETSIPVLNNFENYLVKLNAFELFENSENEIALRDAIVAGSLSISQRGGSGEVNKFRFGQRFLDTLNRNQCSPKKRFSGPTFDVICHVVAGVKKYEQKEFYNDPDKKIQLVRNGKTAWRTHITKGNPALRLMYWQDGDVIELANIGTKKELEIF